jgi:ABC-2 type transport system ATP-binding protein
VLVSSHLMSEVALVADRVVVMGRGRLLADATLDEFTAGYEPVVQVAAVDPGSADRLAAALSGHAERVGADRLRVRGLDAGTVGRRAHDADAVLCELGTKRVSLEEAYVQLVSDEAEYVAVPEAVAA